MKTAIILAACAFVATSQAQNLSGHFLPPGVSYVTIHTGNADLDLAAYEAIDEWNSVLIGATIVGLPPGDTIPGFGNQISEIYFTPLACQMPSGRTTYAQTYVERRKANGNTQSNFVAEFDLQFNSTLPWSSSDFKRILLHEIGHALGFGHPDEEGFDVLSIMLSGSRNPCLDLTDTDIAWTHALYQNHPQMETLLERLTSLEGIVRRLKRKDRLTKTSGPHQQIRKLQRGMRRLQRQLDKISLSIFHG